MHLQTVDKVEFISPEDFKNNYYLPKKPLVITGLAKQWPAYNKWTWEYFKQIVGDKKVGLYNNVKSDAYTPINTADDYKTFGEYVDMDLSHILHTQFAGRKRVLLFRHEEQHKLYRKPFEVLSLADFSNYNQNSGNPDYEKFPALKYANGYELILEPGDTLFMPAGYWHHMEYLDSGFALSLRALQSSIAGKAKGAWNLFGMRSIDTIMKK